MNIVLGASGQVGSLIIENLLQKQSPVRAVIRDAEKAKNLEKQGLEARIADYFNADALKEALAGGELVFLLTPEIFTSKDVLGESSEILKNYREAIQYSGIKKIVGLSSGGAQYASGTGNLLMSHMLEHAFSGLNLTQVFIRPSYYYSNWLPNLSSIKQKGVLQTFYPTDLQIQMNAPSDVADFIADVIAKDIDESKVYELVGQQTYSSDDVAVAFSEALGKKVIAEEIPRKKWHDALIKMKFSEDAAKNFIEMTEIVVAGKGKLEYANPVKLKTTLPEYLKESLKKTS